MESKLPVGAVIISTFASLSLFVLLAGHGYAADVYLMMRKSSIHSLGAKLTLGQITPEYYNEVLSNTNWATECGMTPGRGAVSGIVGGAIVFVVVCLLTTYGVKKSELRMSGKIRYLIASGDSLAFAIVFLIIVFLIDPQILQSYIEMSLALVFIGVLYATSTTYVVLHRGVPEFTDKHLELEYIKLYHLQTKEAVNLGLVYVSSIRCTRRRYLRLAEHT